jgi:hypothetical protein
MAKRKTPAQAHKEAAATLSTLKLTAEAKAMEQTIALLESPQPVVVPYYEYPAYDTWGMGFDRPPYIWTQPDDRTEGRYRPLYENAEDVRRMRAQARSLVEMFPLARAVLQKLSDYIIGNGFDFVVQPKRDYKKDPVAVQLATVIQQLVDRFLDQNRFVGNLDREIHRNSRIDGDVFPALYVDNKQVRIELIDPSFILEPLNKRPLERWQGTEHKLNGWWHGVHTVWNPALKRDDVDRPLGFHAVFDNLGDQFDYLPAWRVEHIKRNVGRMARVGVSDFAIVQQLLDQEGKLLRNTAVGAAILAAIVGIRQHSEGTTQSTVEAMVSTSATSSYQKPIDGGSRTTYQQNVAPGTIKDIPKGMEWLAGPMGSLNQPVYIEVHQHLMRVIGSVWSFPEFLISSDASNNNLASALVAEHPFVKYCEREQAHYADHYERLVWKAVALSHKCGAIAGYSWQQISMLLEINAEYGSPQSRDKYQQAQTNEILSRNGIMSKRTWAADMGIDYDSELEELGGGDVEGGDGAGMEQLQLNGLQVTSASEILHQVSAGETAELVAIGLLQAVGIPPGLARQMVQAAAQKGRERPAAFAAPAAPEGMASDDLPPEFESKQQKQLPFHVRAMDLLMEGTDEGKWITIRGNAVKISDDGEILTGPMKGEKLGGDDAKETPTHSKEDYLALAMQRGHDETHFGSREDADKARRSLGYPENPDKKLDAMGLHQRIAYRKTDEYKAAQEDYYAKATAHKEDMIKKSIGATIIGPGGKKHTVVDWTHRADAGLVPIVQSEDGTTTSINVAQLGQHYRIYKP